MKFNPLFQDSTVSKGANIQTKFELSKLEVNPEESVYLRLVIDNKIKFIEMFKNEKDEFYTSIWVEHRKNLKYQFCVMKEKKVIRASIEKEALALHTIIESWGALLEGSELDKILSDEFTDEVKNIEFVESRDINGEESFDNLIDKWDL